MVLPQEAASAASCGPRFMLADPAPEDFPRSAEPHEKNRPGQRGGNASSL